MRTAIGLLAACALLTSTGAGAASCTISPVSLNFGTYVGLQATSTQSISITCTNTLPLPEQVRYEVRLTSGSSNSFAQRRMQRTSLPLDTLPYNLYLGSVPAVLNTSVWGDGTGGTVFWQGGFNLSVGQPVRTDTNTISGAVPTGAIPAGGSYTDTVTAIITVL